MKNLVIFFSSIILLSACSSIEEAGKVLRNEKINSTDEFLVKKKEPLIMPPDLDKVPEPGTIKDKKETNDEAKIKEIFKMPKSEKGSIKSNSSTEDLIIDKIRK